MKKLIVLGAALAMFASCGNTPKAPQEEEAPAVLRFSTFSDHYFSVMRQDSVSLAEAIARVKAVGIEGIDARTSLTPEQMATFDSLGIQHASAILDVSRSKESIPELEDAAIKFCKDYKFDRLMYCPRLLPEDASAEYVDSVMGGLKAFAQKTIAAGIDLVFEDYDNPQSVTCNMAALDKIFEAVPEANHAYDSGNFYFMGDDPMEAFNHFRSRITHVHLKDRNAVGDRESPALGTGKVPCRQIIDELLNSGYKGWFTIEGYGAKNMIEQLRVSVENMKK